MIGFVMSAARKRALRKAQQASARRRIVAAGRRAQTAEILRTMPKGTKLANKGWAGEFNKNYLNGYSRMRSIARANNAPRSIDQRVGNWARTGAVAAVGTVYVGALGVAGYQVGAAAREQYKEYMRNRKRR